MLQDLYRQQEEISRKIEQIQEECSHPKSSLTIEHGGDTGNYDPTADFYWTTYTCGLCDKSWTETEPAQKY